MFVPEAEPPDKGRRGLMLVGQAIIAGVLVLAYSVFVFLYPSGVGLAVRSLYTTAPLCLALMTWLWTRSPRWESVPSRFRMRTWPTFYSLVALFLLTQSIGIFTAFAGSGRTLFYFTTVGIAAIVISLQLVLSNIGNRWVSRIVLIEICIFTGLELAMKTFVEPQYLGNGDIIRKR